MKKNKSFRKRKPNFNFIRKTGIHTFSKWIILIVCVIVFGIYWVFSFSLKEGAATATYTSAKQKYDVAKTNYDNNISEHKNDLIAYLNQKIVDDDGDVDQTGQLYLANIIMKSAFDVMTATYSLIDSDKSLAVNADLKKAADNAKNNLMKNKPGNYTVLTGKNGVIMAVPSAITAVTAFEDLVKSIDANINKPASPPPPQPTKSSPASMSGTMSASMPRPMSMPSPPASMPVPMPKTS
jgi:ABC-type maltose transport system permease subunit